MAVTVIKNVSRKVAAPKKSKTGLIIGISLLLIGSGLGIYFWYKSKNPKTPTSETDTKTTDDKGSSPTIETTIKTDTNPVVVTQGKPNNVLDFQKWANKYKGASLTEDDKFGDKTKNAWNTYGTEYNKSAIVTSGKGNTLDEVEANLKSKGFVSSQIHRYIKYVKVTFASSDGKARFYATFYSNGQFVISKSIGTTITVLGIGMWSDSGNKIVLDKSGRILKEGIDKNVFSFT